MQRILMLSDYRGFFATKLVGTQEKHTGSTMDTGRLKTLFESRGFEVETSQFSHVDFARDYSGVYVLYASSEDRGLFYKSYIEDVLLALQNAGAILVPRFDMFKAHHNKCFQEMLRQRFSDEALRQPSAISVGAMKSLNTSRTA